MPQYVVKLEHTSDQCPLSNAKVRKRLIKAGPEMPALAQKAGVKFLAGPLVLGTEHASITIVEAANVETVHEFLLRSGLAQWNTATVSPAKSMEESMKDMEKAPPPIY